MRRRRHPATTTAAPQPGRQRVPPLTLISNMTRGLTLSVTLIPVLILTVIAPSSLLAAPCWRPPVSGTVIEPFRAPACPYCSGNRGIELQPAGDAQVVRSVAVGVVTFSGSVAGTIYVVVEHANGWKVTYGRLGSSAVRRGQRVVRGARLGATDGDIYFGLRINGEYRDPEPFLGHPTGRARLVPLDGTVRRAVPAPMWACGARAAAR